MAVVLLASCVGLVIAGTSGGRGSGASVELEHHSAARSSWCSPGPFSAAPGASAFSARTLPDADGLCGGLAVTGMTLWGSGPVPPNILYGIDFPPPFMPTQLGLQASVQQYWFLTAAGQATGPNNLPPLPTSLVSHHPGPAEVFLRVLSYDNKRAPERLLASQLFTNESIIESAGMTAVTHIHSVANDGWLVVRPNDYRANGDMNEYFPAGSLGFPLDSNHCLGLSPNPR